MCSGSSSVPAHPSAGPQPVRTATHTATVTTQREGMHVVRTSTRQVFPRMWHSIPGRPDDPGSGGALLLDTVGHVVDGLTELVERVGEGLTGLADVLGVAHVLDRVAQVLVVEVGVAELQGVLVVGG